MYLVMGTQGQLGLFDIAFSDVFKIHYPVAWINRHPPVLLCV